jgi:hypothetical protein
MAYATPTIPTAAMMKMSRDIFMSEIQGSEQVLMGIEQIWTCFIVSGLVVQRRAMK